MILERAAVSSIKARILFNGIHIILRQGWSRKFEANVVFTQVMAKRRMPMYGHSRLIGRATLPDITIIS